MSSNENMNTDKPAANHEKVKLRKLITTRNIIKNKFKKARKHRFENENDATLAMKPFAVFAPLSTIMKPTPIGNSSFTPAAKIQCDPNELCNKLRQLVNSQIGGNMNCTPEITSIIDNLREYGILL